MYEGRSLSRYDTAYLIVLADFLAIVLVIVLLLPLPVVQVRLEDSLLIAVVGLLLVGTRVVVLLYLMRCHKRIAESARRSIQRRRAHKRRADIGSGRDWSAIAERYIDGHLDVYRSAIVYGLAGYAVLVTVSGGPFSSPFAPFLVAAFFLGQIRSALVRDTGVILVGALVVIGGSAAISVNLMEEWIGAGVYGNYSGWSYVPAFVFVAAVTTWVNVSTLFERMPAVKARPLPSEGVGSDQLPRLVYVVVGTEMVSLYDAVEHSRSPSPTSSPIRVAPRHDVRARIESQSEDGTVVIDFPGGLCLHLEVGGAEFEDAVEVVSALRRPQRQDA